MVWNDTDASAIDTAVYTIVDGEVDTATTSLELFSYSTSQPTAIGIAAISDSLYAVACNRTGTTDKGVLVGCKFDSGAVTKGTEADFYASAVPYLAMTGNVLNVHIYYPNSGRLYGITASVDSVTKNITLGSPQNILGDLPNQISAVSIDGLAKDFIAYSNDDDSDKCYGMVITLNGGSHVISGAGSTKLKDAAITAVNVAYVSETAVYVAYMTAGGLAYTLVTLSGHQILSVATETAFPAGAVGYPLIFNSGLGLVLLYRDNAGTPRFNVLAGGPGNMKVLGASISKGLGDTLYLTAWGDNGELVYFVHSMDDLSLLGAFSLGDCTEEELNDKTYYAMPLAPFGDDLFCWFYGRFNPLGVGLSQIIYTADLGATLTVFEASWGNAYCGSLIDDFGLVFAAWCNGNQTKLYTGDWQSVLELKSTLLFSAAINPFSMVYNFYDDSLYAAASAGQTVMVIKANSPFTSWADITYDHSTAAGINAIVAL
jgi:hypothetical protein